MPPLLRTADVQHDVPACINDSTCEETWLVTGSLDATEVVVFTHTMYDAGWQSFYKLFDGWEPPFLAVALEMPGDISGIDIADNGRYHDPDDRNESGGHVEREHVAG